MMADAKHFLDFLEGRVGMFADVRLEFFGVELAPFSPTGLGSEGAGLNGRQIAVNRTSTQGKAPRGLNLGTTRLDEFDDPFPQI